MREILFRGKRLQGGHWVEGYFFKSDINYRERTSGKASLIFTPDCDTFIMIPEAHNSVMVQGDTVGQFTGLTDKNGKKIFEGDICKENSGAKSTLVCLGRPELANHVGVVKFGIHQVPSDDPYVWGEAYGFFLYGGVATPAISMYRPEEDNYGNGLELDVIGNIHDNPELIGGERDG